MPSLYKKPGVYINEISKFPPTVAQVETAIPVFIGYTHLAEKKGIDITGKPEPARTKDNIVALIEWRDGTVIDAVKEVESHS